MIKVIVPNKNYNEKVFGVQFHNGVAEFEDEEKGREIAKRFGYEVEEQKTAPAKRKTRKAPTKKEELKEGE